MTIPHSKILSPTLTSPKSDATSSSKVEQNTNVNINIDNSSNPASTTTSQPSAVIYPNPYDTTPITTTDTTTNDTKDRLLQSYVERVTTLTDSVEFLKLIIQAYRDNAIYFNKYIVLTESDLKNLINSLVHADRIDITYDPDFPGCCSTSTKKLSKIENIMIHTDTNSSNFKYSHSDAYGLIQAYTISLKYVITK